jgi:hypothetical protein
MGSLNYKGNEKFHNLWINYMVSLHFIDFISWGILDNGPLY